MMEASLLQNMCYSLSLGATSSFSKTVFSSIDPDNTKVLDEYTLELKLLTICSLEALSRPWCYVMQGCT